MGGARGNRTPDLLHAKETRYQLRYSPKSWISAQVMDIAEAVNKLSVLLSQHKKSVYNVPRQVANRRGGCSTVCFVGNSALPDSL